MHFVVNIVSAMRKKMFKMRGKTFVVIMLKIISTINLFQ